MKNAKVVMADCDDEEFENVEPYVTGDSQLTLKSTGDAKHVNGEVVAIFNDWQYIAETE